MALNELIRRSWPYVHVGLLVNELTLASTINALIMFFRVDTILLEIFIDNKMYVPIKFMSSIIVLYRNSAMDITYDLQHVVE